jgi:hypothetical protein
MTHAQHHHLTFLVAVMGAVAAICAFFPDAHVLGSWVGLAGIVTGVIAQYRSETTAERWVIIIATGAAAVGLALNPANGGLY